MGRGKTTTAETTTKPVNPKHAAQQARVQEKQQQLAEQQAKSNAKHEAMLQEMAKLEALKDAAKERLDEKLARKIRAKPTLQEIWDSEWSAAIEFGSGKNGKIDYRIKIKSLGRVIHVHTTNLGTILGRAHIIPKIMEQSTYGPSSIASSAAGGKWYDVSKGKDSDPDPNIRLPDLKEYGEAIKAGGEELKKELSDGKYEYVFYNDNCADKNKWYGAPKSAERELTVKIVAHLGELCKFNVPI